MGVKFRAPSLWARVLSGLYYYVLLVPMGTIVARWWMGGDLRTIRQRIGFWVACEGWFHYERMEGRI